MSICAQSPSHVQFYVTLWTVACQAPLSMGFFRQEYWSGLPFPPPGDLPSAGIKPTSLASPALQVDFFAAEPTGKPMHKHYSLPAHNYSFHFQSSFLLFKSQTLPYLHHMLLMYVLLSLSRNVKILKKVTKKQYFHMTLLGKTLSLRSVFLPRTH